MRLENSTHNGNVKKNVLFAALFLYNLALITHDATKSVNPFRTSSDRGDIVISRTVPVNFFCVRLLNFKSGSLNVF